MNPYHPNAHMSIWSSSQNKSYLIITVDDWNYLDPQEKNKDSIRETFIQSPELVFKLLSDKRMPKDGILLIQSFLADTKEPESFFMKFIAILDDKQFWMDGHIERVNEAMGKTDNMSRQEISRGELKTITENNVEINIPYTEYLVNKVSAETLSLVNWESIMVKDAVSKKLLLSIRQSKASLEARAKKVRKLLQ